MRIFAKTLACLIAYVIGVSAQNLPNRQGGVYLATAYNYLIDSSFYGGFGPYTFTTSACTNAVALGTRAFDPFNTNASVTVADSNPANTETVAFVSQNLTGGFCVLQLAVTKSHTSYQLTSGTFGLQEAINDATANGGGNIVVDTRWHGTTAMITGAAGNATVSITDNRTGSAIYTWNGATYVLTGGLPPATLDVRALGVKGDAVTDDTTAFQNAVNAICPSASLGGSLLIPSTLHIKITSTINFTKCWAITVDGGQATGETNGSSTSGAQIVWAGAAGGTVLLVNQTRDSVFKNFSILTQTTAGQNNANVCIDIDEQGSVTTITTNNLFQNISCRSHDSNSNLNLIRLGQVAPANVERQVFEHLTLDCSDQVATSSNNGIAWGLGNGGTPQPNRIKIHDINTANCSNAINLVGALADIVDIDLGDFSHNYTDLTTGVADNHVTYRNIRSEVCVNPIVITAGNSNPLTLDNLSFSGCTGTLFTLPANGSRTIRMTNIKSDNGPTAFAASTSNISYSIFADNNVWPSGFTVDPTFFPTHFPNGVVLTRNYSFTAEWPNQITNFVPTFSSLPFATINALSPPNGTEYYCSDCKNAQDDSVAFDSTATGSGHGTNVLRENGAWRVH